MFALGLNRNVPGWGNWKGKLGRGSNVCNSKEGKHIKTNWNLFSRSMNRLGD